MEWGIEPSPTLSQSVVRTSYTNSTIGELTCQRTLEVASMPLQVLQITDLQAARQHLNSGSCIYLPSRIVTNPIHHPVSLLGPSGQALLRVRAAGGGASSDN